MQQLYKQSAAFQYMDYTKYYISTGDSSAVAKTA
jgi:hypothetical protein